MRLNVFASALIAAAVQADTLQEKWNIVTDESLTDRSIFEQMQEIVMKEVGTIPDDGAEETVRVAKSQYDTNFEYNYPGIITMATGSKYNVGANFQVQYNEPNTGYSGLSLQPYVGANEDMWSGVILLDTVQWYFYTRLTLFKIVPIMIDVTFPNYLVSPPGHISGTCLKIHSKVTFMSAMLRMTANSFRYFLSVTDWLANDMDDSHWFNSGFDDNYEQTGGWMNLGHLWSGSWEHYKICAK